MTNPTYDPADVMQHANKTYTTQNSIYSFDEQGRFHGRDSVENCVPELVAGLHQEYEQDLKGIFGNGEREKLRDLLRECGEKPQKGKYLVMVLTEEDAEEKERVGFKSSALEQVE